MMDSSFSWWCPDARGTLRSLTTMRVGTDEPQAALVRMNDAVLQACREDRSWSQDELNLRTLQRIPKEAEASLQSNKVFTAVSQIDARALDFEETAMQPRYEYKTVQIDPEEGFLTGVRRGKLPDFEGVLNAEGKAGWKLVQILTPGLAQGVWAAKTGRYVALLQREYFEAV